MFIKRNFSGNTKSHIMLLRAQQKFFADFFPLAISDGFAWSSHKTRIKER